MFIIEEYVSIENIYFTFEEKDIPITGEMTIDGNSFGTRKSYHEFIWDVSENFVPGKHFIEISLNKKVRPLIWISLYDFLDQYPCIECLQCFGVSKLNSFGLCNVVIDIDCSWSKSYQDHGIH